MPLTTLTATYRVVTPMFPGGAEPQRVAELRLPSFKGALRFWWRALAWARGIRDVAELRRQEANLFGNSETNVGQSKVLLRLPAHNPEKIEVGQILGKTGKRGNPPGDVVEDGARYLGYGLMDSFDGKNTVGGRLTRPCLAAPFEFSVDLIFRPELNDSSRQEVISALKLFGLCGGFGSRSRRGYGSGCLTKLSGLNQDSWKPPVSVEAWAAEFKLLAGGNGVASPLPLWTSLAPGQTKVVILRDIAQSRLELLARLGRDFVFFRSWGRNGKVLGLDSEKRFRDDHDLMKSSSHQRRAHPRRVAFGLPHNYGKRVDEQVGPAGPNLDRRASPMFFHIHQPFPSAPPLGVVLFLPALFLPADRNYISVGGAHVPLAHKGEGAFWGPAHDFLERLRSGTGKDKFSETHLVAL